MEKDKAYDMSENTAEEIINKITAMANIIRLDYLDPRSEVKTIIKLCARLTSRWSGAPNIKEIKDQMYQAIEIQAEGKGCDDKCYEQGVVAALLWVLGESEDEPV